MYIWIHKKVVSPAQNMMEIRFHVHAHRLNGFGYWNSHTINYFNDYWLGNRISMARKFWTFDQQSYQLSWEFSDTLFRKYTVILHGLLERIVMKWEDDIFAYGWFVHSHSRRLSAMWCEFCTRYYAKWNVSTYLDSRWARGSLFAPNNLKCMNSRFLDFTV